MTAKYNNHQHFYVSVPYLTNTLWLIGWGQGGVLSLQKSLLRRSGSNVVV